MFVSQVWANGLLSLGLFRAILAVNIAVLVLNAALVSALVPLDGARGAAIGTAVAEIAAALLQAFVVIRRRPQLRPSLRRVPLVLLAGAVGLAPLALTGLPVIVRVVISTTVYVGVVIVDPRLPGGAARPDTACGAVGAAAGKRALIALLSARGRVAAAPRPDRSRARALGGHRQARPPRRPPPAEARPRRHGGAVHEQSPAHDERLERERPRGRPAREQPVAAQQEAASEPRQLALPRRADTDRRAALVDPPCERRLGCAQPARRSRRPRSTSSP